MTMRLTILLALAALSLSAAQVQAAARPNELPGIDNASTVEVLADGSEVLIAHEPALSLHWSPARGFHHGRNCCKRGTTGRGARVSTQRFAGIDAAAGRPVYVRDRF